MGTNFLSIYRNNKEKYSNKFKTISQVKDWGTLVAAPNFCCF